MGHAVIVHALVPHEQGSGIDGWQLAERAGPIHPLTLGESLFRAIRNELLIYLARSDEATYFGKSTSDDLGPSPPKRRIAKIRDLRDIQI
jgi:hypothetical protein